ncbi:MAG: alpha-amylase family glycosyl hydrolase [Candidatus Marinimicrobia bacterium]|nr:alpha-amylase family glycosyl hydrolase [Candidatus Neomarinimicrobiota bacterium]
MVSDAIWWLESLDLDGFRHDAVKHVPHLFWRSLTREIRRNFPGEDIYQIGETFGDHSLVKSYVNNGQLSAQFNFNLYWPARYAFCNGKRSFRAAGGRNGARNRYLRSASLNGKSYGQP